MKKLALLLVMMISFGSQSAIAQTIEDEEQFDQAIQKFGYISGAAFQCTTSEQAKNIQAEALRAFTGITRLFGSDRSFFYAAAYGVGATDTIDSSKCPGYISSFEKTIEEHGLKEGE